MKKSLTTRKSIFIELIELIFCKKNQCPRLKACAKRQLKKFPKSSKNGQNQDLEPRFHRASMMFITTTKSDLATK